MLRGFPLEPRICEPLSAQPRDVADRRVSLAPLSPEQCGSSGCQVGCQAAPRRDHRSVGAVVRHERRLTRAGVDRQCLRADPSEPSTGSIPEPRVGAVEECPGSTRGPLVRFRRRRNRGAANDLAALGEDRGSDPLNQPKFARPRFDRPPQSDTNPHRPHPRLAGPYPTRQLAIRKWLLDFPTGSAAEKAPAAQNGTQRPEDQPLLLSKLSPIEQTVKSHPPKIVGLVVTTGRKHGRTSTGRLGGA